MTIISHVHSQGCDNWKLRSGQDEPPWSGAAQSVGCLSESRFDVDHNKVRLRPLLDRIPFNHWNQFYHQHAPPLLQARRVGDSPNLGPSPSLHPVFLLLYPPSLTRPLGYCRTRTLLVSFLRVFPRRICSHPHLWRQSAGDAVCSGPLVVGALCVRTSRRRRNGGLLFCGGRKQDRSRVQLRGPCGLGRSCLGLHQRTRPAIGDPISSLDA